MNYRLEFSLMVSQKNLTMAPAAVTAVAAALRWHQQREEMNSYRGTARHFRYIPQIVKNESQPAAGRDSESLQDNR